MAEMLDDPEWNVERERREKALLSAAEALLAHTYSARIELPGEGVAVVCYVTCAPRRPS